MQQFTESAGKIVFSSQHEAQRLNASEVEPEHFLLALLHDEEVTHILTEMGIDLDALRAEIDRLLLPGTGTKPDMRLPTRGKRVIDFAYEEARQLKDNDIGPEHLLLGALREREELQGQTQDDLGLTLSQVREGIALYRRPLAEQKKLAAEQKKSAAQSGQILQRFTERARKVIFFAREEALQLGTRQVAPEYLLLGLIREKDSVAIRILDRIGVTRDALRVAILERITSIGDVLGQDFVLTSESKRVIDLCYDESRRLNNNYIGTEHLLLGLIREETSLAAHILIELGVTLERTREQVRLMQSGE